MLDRFIVGAAVGGVMMCLAVIGVALSGIKTIPGPIAMAYVCAAAGIAAALVGAA